jgi:hypothetical protein
MAYLIVFKAGVILSSFHQDKIINKPHHKMKSIEATQATKTKIEITNKTISQGSVVLESKGLVFAANACS